MLVAKIPLQAMKASIALRAVVAVTAVLIVVNVMRGIRPDGCIMYLPGRQTARGLGGKENIVSNVQCKRMAMLKDYCKSNSLKSQEFPPRNRFVVNERYKLLYCQVFKTGSTTTLTILHNLEHNERRSTHDMRAKLEDLPFKRLADYTDEEVRLRLETYSKLLIVRNPLERLASAWQDKFIFAPSEYWRKRYHSMVETISQNPSDGQITPEATNNKQYPQVPFTAFIKAVATNKTEWEDPHWQLISNLCAPCLINYDFIAHTDTIAQDFPLFFKKAAIVGRDDLLPENRQQKAEKMFWELYKQIPMGDMRRIKQKFDADYEMFGFSFNNDITRLLD
ncbi:carbohydrate sulfotransferase 10-like [Branchiostoma floridae]|uniref:Carbohydrate sulfotransferase n=1 Tax=Branchiostoma floridae TaxID=7739 RepID=A0A9J7KR18_BRAFL|nr:carbohydrate sulfotransferase 10-like [Branchiostoma floridae]